MLNGWTVQWRVSIAAPPRVANCTLTHLTMPLFPNLLLTRSHGFVVGHVVPEAQVGGPIALIKNGDIIAIDAIKNFINAPDITEEEWGKRRKEWEETEHPLKVNQGTLYKYVKTVSDAAQGCVTDA